MISLDSPNPGECPHTRLQLSAAIATPNCSGMKIVDLTISGGRLRLKPAMNAMNVNARHSSKFHQFARFAALSLCLLSTCVSIAAAKQPNVVVILTDD